MDLIDLVANRVTVIAEGEWAEDRVRVYSASFFAPKITREMEVAAIARFITRRESNPKLFNGPARHLLCSKCSVGDNGFGSLELALGPISYAVFDICRKELAEALGWNIDGLPIGVGMSVVVLTSDFKIVMHRRGRDVDFPGALTLVGGILDQDRPFEHVRQELREELGIERHEVGELLLLGISHRLEQRINNEFDFFARVFVSSGQLKQRQSSVEDKEGELNFMECDPGVVQAFVMERHKEMLPGQVFCLIQAGRHLWGSEWSEIRGGLQ